MDSKRTTNSSGKGPSSTTKAGKSDPISARKGSRSAVVVVYCAIALATIGVLVLVITLALVLPGRNETSTTTEPFSLTNSTTRKPAVPFPPECGKRSVNPFPFSETSSSLDTDPASGLTDVNEGEYPWMLWFRSSNGDSKFDCGATILNARFALTAAQCCVHGFNLSTQQLLPDWSAKIYGGMVFQREQDRAKLTKDIGYCFTHNFQDTYRDSKNDIALLRIKSGEQDMPLSINNNLNSVCLPRDENLIRTDGTVEMTGWNLGKDDPEINDRLQKAQFNYRFGQDCQNSTQDVKAQLCLMPNKDRGPEYMRIQYCIGDEGGPLMRMNPRDKRVYQVSLHSRLAPCFGPKLRESCSNHRH